MWRGVLYAVPHDEHNKRWCFRCALSRNADVFGKHTSHNADEIMCVSDSNSNNNNIISHLTKKVHSSASIFPVPSGWFGGGVHTVHESIQMCIIFLLLFITYVFIYSN